MKKKEKIIMNNYSKLLNNFEMIKLDKIREFYPNYIDNVSK
jgi:hypothetical protein